MTDKIFLAYTEKHTNRNRDLAINFAWPNYLQWLWSFHLNLEQLKVIRGIEWL